MGSDAFPSVSPAPAAAPGKAPKKKAVRREYVKLRIPDPHLQYKMMVAAAVTALKERGGSSRQAILNYIMINYPVGNVLRANLYLKVALKDGVATGLLKQSKGTGDAGFFRIGNRKMVGKIVKKPKFPTKATMPEKPTSAKNAAKSPKKATNAKKAAKSPKKAAVKKTATATKPKTLKKTAAAKPKKAETPKKPKASKPKAATPKAAKKPTAQKTKTSKKAASQ